MLQIEIVAWKATLIVDSSKFNPRVMQRVLEKLGCRKIPEVADAERPVEVYQATKPNLIDFKRRYR